MSQHASGLFTINTWDAQPYDEREDVTLTLVHVAKTIHSEIEGSSTAELLMVGTTERPATYVGIDRITAKVNGRAGAFILQHNAVAAHGEQRGEWIVVPGSDSGALCGLSGTGNIEIGPVGSHAQALNYDNLPDD